MNVLTRIGNGAILGAALTGTAAAGAQSPLPGIDRYVERVLADWKHVGAAIAVVRGGEVIYARGFGLREVGKPAPVTTNTLFQIGSTTKAFTTAALAILVDEGKIRWDDPVVEHLPGFQLQDPWLTRRVTIRDAVTHRSGVPDNYYPYLAIMTRDEVVRQLRYLTPDAGFRDSFRYNNLMYAAAGKVIEAASGTTWDDFVTRRLLEALGMTRSGTSAYQYWDSAYVAPTFYGSARRRAGADRARDTNVAMPHGVGEDGSTSVLPWVNFDSPAPAGSIVASISGMANWVMMQLDEGRFAGRQVIRPETVREMHTPQNRRVSAKPFPLDTLDGYGLGWFTGRYRGQRHVAHSGGMLGFPAYVAMLPDPPWWCCRTDRW
jgi:CubicO group peptidase (beta-lactamase class C family)